MSKRFLFHEGTSNTAYQIRLKSDFRSVGCRLGDFGLSSRGHIGLENLMEFLAIFTARSFNNELS